MRYFSILVLSTLLLSACSTIDTYKTSRVQMKQNFSDIESVNPQGDAYDLEKAVFYMGQYVKAEVDATSATQDIVQNLSRANDQQKVELGQTFSNTDYMDTVREVSTFTFYLAFAKQACDKAQISGCDKMASIVNDHQAHSSKLMNNYQAILAAVK